MNDRDDALRQAIAWAEAGKSVALATVVATWGSSPRQAGSQMAVAADGAFAGSVSGGCLEGAVVQAALAAIKEDASRLLSFEASDERAWEVGLACGGSMKVLVEPAPPVSDLRRLLESRPIAVVTDVASGRRAFVTPTDVSGGLALDPAACEKALALLAEDRAAPADDTGTIFVNVFNKPLRLVIVGAVHIAQALAPMAVALGFDAAVIDPRRAFASAARFPNVRLQSEWPDEAMATLGLDERTAVVVLSHDPKIDDPALVAALTSRAFYIGALGARRTHEKRCARLREAGVPDEALKRIHAPVGLDLGGRAPAEIALAVLSEIVAVKNGRQA